MTKALVRNGADKVYIIGRRKEALDEATRLDSDHIIPIMGDVTSQGSLSAVADRIWADVGYVNLVIANAGSPGARASPIKADSGIAKVQADLQGVSMADFVNTFAINTAGVYYTLVEFLGLLDAGNRKGNVEQKSHFITTSSVSAFNRQATGSLAYGASKAATIQLMKALSTQMTPLGIRSNVIVPGCQSPRGPVCLLCSPLPMPLFSLLTVGDCSVPHRHDHGLFLWKGRDDRGLISAHIDPLDPRWQGRRHGWHHPVLG